MSCSLQIQVPKLSKKHVFPFQTYSTVILFVHQKPGEPMIARCPADNIDPQGDVVRALKEPTWPWIMSLIAYPFSHNHGSVENYPKWKEHNIGDTSIFHFHDYGRKGTLPETNSKSTWKCMVRLEYDRFLLGPGLFSGVMLDSFRECSHQSRHVFWLFHHFSHLTELGGVSIA